MQEVPIHRDAYDIPEQTYDFDRTSSVSSILIIDGDESDQEDSFQSDRKRGVSEHDGSYGSTAPGGVSALSGAAPAAVRAVLNPTIKKLFICAVFMQLVNSMDRGIIPGSLEKIQTDFGMTKTETGSLNSAFLGGVVLGIPVATVLANRNTIPPFQLVSFGMWIWITCVVMAALSQSYPMLLAARILTGVGDACFQVICIPFIDQNAPVEHRGKMMSLFIAMYPIGVALGTGLSGVAGASSLGWRSMFYLEAMLMFPATLIPFFVVFHEPNSDVGKAEDVESSDKTRLLSPDGSPTKNGRGRSNRAFVGSSNGGGLKTGAMRSEDALLEHADGLAKEEEESGKGNDLTEREALMGATDSEGRPLLVAEKGSFRTTVLPVLLNPLCVLSCLGYAGLMATSAGFGYWAIYYAEKNLGADARTASLGVSVLTVSAAFIGTISGGILLDATGKCNGGKSAALTCVLCATGAALTIPMGFLAISTDEVLNFFIFATAAIYFMLMAGTSFPLVILWVVKLEQRVTASAMASFVTNVAGTVPAPIVVGWLSEHFQEGEGSSQPIPREVMYGVFSWMLWPCLLSIVVGLVCKAKGIGANVDHK